MDTHRPPVDFLYILHSDLTLWRFKLPLIRRLLQDGHRVTVSCPPGPFTPQFASAGIQHVPWRLIRENKNPWFEIQTVLHIRRIIRELSPGLIHTFTARPNLYGSWANRLAWKNIPLVNSVMGLGTLYIDCQDGSLSLKHRVMNGMYKWAFAQSRKVIFLNQDDCAWFLQHRIVQSCQARLIRGEGVDLDFFHPVDSRKQADLRRELPLPANAIVILMVARLIREKGVLEFCRAAQVLKEKYNNKVHFVVVGDIDQGNPSCLSWDDLYGFRNTWIVQFTGHLDEPQPYFAASDIYCLPSYREGLPVTVQEAMASGLPVVTTESPGCRETIDEGVSGFLVPVRNVEALVDRLDRLIQDPALRERLGRAGREKAVREFSVEKIVDQHIAIYEEILYQDIIS
ncbi:MAG: glycosyltransferase family 4 protein [bacterium]